MTTTTITRERASADNATIAFESGAWHRWTNDDDGTDIEQVRDGDQWCWT